MRTIAALACFLLLIALPASAQACRVLIMPEQRIAHGYDNDAIMGIAVVEIVSARFIGEAYADSHPWEAQAKVVQSLWGERPFPETIEFIRGGGSSMCEWNLPPLPKAGDRWVVYFSMDCRSLLQPWLAVTPQDARTFDPRLAGKRF